MKVIDLYHETRTSLLSNLTRTFLTVLGIVIGIASVIIMLSIGQGAQDSIASSINSLGSNVLTVRPGGQAAPGVIDTGSSNIELTNLDVDEMEKLTLAKDVAPSVQTRSQIVAPGKNSNSTILGVTPAYANVSNITMDEGNFISDEQNRSFSKVIVLGPTAKTTLFGDAEAIGQTLKIKTNTYTVVGITVAKGGTGFNNPDENVYIPLSTAQQYLTGGSNIATIAVSAKSADDMTQLQTDLTDLLIKIHRVADPAYPGFRILNQQDLLTTVSSVATTFTILLGSVAGISLLVGGIGIMNMMLTSVRERTKEIGLRKAIGAQRKDIQTQFLTEAIVITMSGGVIGIILGYLVSYGITFSGVIATSVSAFSVFLSFTVSVGIGIIFGYYPAKKAAELNPIDALRYE
jgi:ABC-type antimicrobial peptide transport system permease subunit